MTKRLVAIGIIWAGTALAWLLLANTLDSRSRAMGASNREGVEALWGRELRQEAPSLRAGEAAATPLASDIRVDLDLTHRKKGLIWFPTYRVRFEAAYRVRTPEAGATPAVVRFPLPDAQAVYDGFVLSVDGEPVADVQITEGCVEHRLDRAPGEEVALGVVYTSQGMGTWHYAFGRETKQVRDFTLQMDTDFDAIDFPATGSSPTTKTRTADGWQLQWRYANLLSGVQIGMVMPDKLNPGPWVERVSMSAPVSLFLFFFLLFIFSTLRGVRIHPMNYFFLAAAFFSYHLLLSYLVDHISIHVAFWISSGVSVFLVVSYMRLVVGARMALLEVGVAQFVYLVLFSYTFFFEGVTGLAITILCIATLFIVMQITGRIDWEIVFRGDDASGAGVPADEPPPLPADG